MNYNTVTTHMDSRAQTYGQVTIKPGMRANLASTCLSLVPGPLAATSYSVDMAKFKNHTTHNRSQKWCRNGSRKPTSQTGISSRGGPQAPEEHMLCQEAQQERAEEGLGQQWQGRVHMPRPSRPWSDPRKCEPVPRESAASSFDLTTSPTPSSGSMLVSARPKVSG